MFLSVYHRLTLTYYFSSYLFLFYIFVTVVIWNNKILQYVSALLDLIVDFLDLWFSIFSAIWLQPNVAARVKSAELPGILNAPSLREAH